MDVTGGRRPRRGREGRCSGRPAVIDHDEDGDEEQDSRQQRGRASESHECTFHACGEYGVRLVRLEVLRQFEGFSERQPSQKRRLPALRPAEPDLPDSPATFPAVPDRREERLTRTRLRPFRALVVSTLLASGLAIVIGRPAIAAAPLTGRQVGDRVVVRLAPSAPAATAGELAARWRATVTRLQPDADRRGG